MHLILFVFILSDLSIVYGNLDDMFHNYDIVREVRVHSLSRREVRDTLHTKELSLAAFGQNFTLELKPSHDLFTRDFTITIVHSDNSKEVLQDFDKNNFFTAHVVGEMRSRGTMHIDENNLVTGVFTSHGEEITVEPLSNYMEPEDEAYSQTTMIAYRRTDIKSDPKNAPLCGSVHANVSDDDEYEINFRQFQTEDGRHRRRRDTAEVGKTCMLAVVADYKFFNHIGHGNKFTTANYIANIINRVNQIYRPTVFSGVSGYGFEIISMVVHDGPTTSLTDNAYYYNQAKTDWGTSELLEAFGRATEHGDKCLAHLFTSQAMPSSVLGLGYIASSRVGSIGGICSPGRTYHGHPSIFNIGWSSSLNGAGSAVTYTQQTLVTAHEFGHNWGSEHDPSSGDCAPGSILGSGKYLMYSYSVSGTDGNNDEFSSCSKLFMNGVIANKRASCFEVASVETPCGNGRLDSGEECDEGFLGKLGQGECCTDMCELQPGAQCSSSNDACCTQCQLASSTLQCQSDIDGSCQGASLCDGVNYACPEPPNKSDFTACIEEGSCLRGVCIPFCEFRGYNSCVCETVEDSCKRCCYEGGQCSVRGPSLVADGRSCIQGYCDSGVCTKVSTRMVERFWDLIDTVSVDYLLEFFKTNIVTCVTILSLLIYIPICIIIWFIDRMRKRDWEKENSVHIRTDRGLSHDEDRRLIEQPGQPSSRTRPSTLDASDLLDSSSYRASSSKNQIQPLGRKPRNSHA